MGVDGPTALIQALDNMCFSDVEGTPESDWIDFKRTVYPFDTNNQLRLSARFGEERDPSMGVPVAGPVRPIPCDRVDLAHYRDILAQGIYPPIRGVEIKWFHSDNAQSEGVLVITVRRSSEIGRAHV